MNILLFFISFYLLFSHSLQISDKRSIANSFFIAALSISGLVLISTELLSIINVFNSFMITVFWGSVCFVEVIIHYKHKFSFICVYNEFIIAVRSFFNQFNIFQKISLILLSVLLLLILVQGIVYPPNNWDSMTYHLPRVMHWIQNESTNNYATNITRQIYSPPFSEYFITHMQLLSGNDYFSNFVQFFFLIGSIVSSYLIIKIFTRQTNALYLIILLTCTLPEAILEASSTQNDIVHAFFLLSSVYFSIRIVDYLTTSRLILWGLSIGLALLSKIMAYFYMPWIVLFTVLIILIKNKKNLLNTFKRLVLGGIIILTVNLAFTLKKIQFNNSISGTSKEIDKGITFEKYSPLILLSSDIKNTCLHFDEFFVGNLGNRIAEKTHQLIGEDINEIGTNVFDSKFDCTHEWKNHEDSQANFIHLLLYFIAILAFLRMLIQGKRKIISIESTLLIILFLQFNFLNLIIRWEPWNSRIHTPLFFETNLFIVLIFKDLQRMKFMQYSVLILCIVYGLFISIFNYSRPFITSKKYTSSIHINDTRYDKYFANRMWVKDEYSSFVNLLNKENNSINVGFISHIDGWEYPLLVVQFNKPNIHFDYIKINNTSVKYLKKKKYKYIYSSYLNKKLLYYNNNKFKNIFTKNKNLFVYKREN